VEARLLFLLIPTQLTLRQLASFSQNVSTLEHHKKDESQQRPQNFQNQSSILAANVMEEL